MRKKAVFCITFLLLFLSGCSSVPDSSADENEIQNIENSVSIDTAQQGKDTDIVNEFEDIPLVPNYYHSVSDTDETGIYLGGVGGIYKIDSESKMQTLYSAPHVVGAALYEDYIFALEYNITDSGMTTDLIRINKNDSGKEVMTQVNSGSYDLKIIDNMLVISVEILGEYSFETTFQTYTLDDNGNLTSDTPQDIYAQYELPGGYENDMRFLILPIFSTKYFNYSCFIKSKGEIDINSIWIRKGDEESVEEVVTCSGIPLVTIDRIFYCDSNENTLMQRDFDDAQETALYQIPDDDSLLLLTYDAKWVYFLQKPKIDEFNELSSSIMRVNLQDHRAEEVYGLQPGSYMNNFNVYGNYCYFILSDTDNTAWKCCDLTDFTITELQ